jgi:signal peptidase I
MDDDAQGVTIHGGAATAAGAATGAASIPHGVGSIAATGEEPAQDPVATPKRGHAQSRLRQVLVTILCGAVFAILLQITVQNYVVEGTSMLPNVHSGDRVLVDRLAYRVGSPRRGDIVVFRFPWSSSNLIKRVIGLPGDTVQVTPAVVRVNGQVVHEPYIRYVEQYTYRPARVPAGDYFVLGDNRVVSYDSHIWGFLPRNYLYGRVMVTYWPMNDFHLYGL